MLSQNPHLRSFPQGEAPLTVTCTDTTLDYAEKRYWDFGDGTQGSDKIMEHRYDEPGDYTITLTVWAKEHVMVQNPRPSRYSRNKIRSMIFLAFQGVGWPRFAHHTR
jgi:hypothetical protein